MWAAESYIAIFGLKEDERIAATRKLKDKADVNGIFQSQIKSCSGLEKKIGSRTGH
jgi:hypothetical protein